MHVPQSIAADFSTPDGPDVRPGLIGVYQTPLLNGRLEALLDSLALLKPLGVRDLRYELGWGKGDVFLGRESARSLEGFVPLLHALRKHKLRPLFAVGYNPFGTNPDPGTGDWRDLPPLDRWRTLCRDWARLCRREFGTGAAYEVWNEPDFEAAGRREFFRGSQEDYARLYASAVEGLSEGDPGAPVGGPAAAYWFTGFLEPLLRDRRRLDFVSVHAYGRKPLVEHAAAMQAIAVRQGRKELPLLVSEYNSFDGSALASANSFRAASAFFEDATRLLALPGIRTTYWAQWLDPGLFSPSYGMIGADQLGNRIVWRLKPIYHAMRLWARLPLARRRATVQGDGLGALASCDQKRATLALWSESEEDRDVAVELTGLPFRPRTLSLTRMDALQAVPTPVEAPFVATWKGTLPGRGLLLLEITK